MASPAAFQSQIYRTLPALERADTIAQRISTAISLGMLREGERLPAESELSEMFGVAGATLRDALASLREQGIVETRRGRSGGTFVVKAPPAARDLMRRYLAETSLAELRDLGDEHAAITAATVRLACGRADPQALDRLEQLARAQARAETPEARARADSRFHIELAVAAQSPRLLASEIRLQGEISQVLWTPLAGDFDVETTTVEHLQLVQAIRSDDPETAQRLALEHIRRNIYHLIDTKLTLSYSDRTRESM
ncbi:FadR/GntR family transcriptional regulator [Arthrobacter mobilis]|uniref:FadR family transcriptional regulator n=1 Tax=Arthrobacter mobilis TaxID=2724944 RepID=A0A7X6K6E6_9MICC|nr:FCD domain-containing protein [Arthrobacter mobilis]NKX55190.1 FadR family transcriptional regulator [Arthrobacter mobilis]